LRSVTGIEAPGSGDNEQSVIDYKSALVLAESLDGRPFLPGSDWISGFHRNYLPFAPSTRSSLGFDSRNIDLILTTGPEGAHPDRGLEVVIGAIDADVAASLLPACEECVPHEVATHCGVEFFTWGNDSEPSLQDRLGIPAHDEFGRGGRNFIGDGYVVRTLFTESIEGTIDTVADPARGLYGNENFTLAARAVSSAGIGFGTNVMFLVARYSG
jgi:hypothetical protein